MKLTNKQIQALDDISRGGSTAEYHHTQATTRRSLFRHGLIQKDWNHRHAYGSVEYLRLTDAGKEVAAKLLFWDTEQ